MSIINTGLINKLEKKKLAKAGGYLRGNLLASLNLTAISINTAGTGYTANDIICVDNTGATTASGSEVGTICVQTVDGSGIIQTAAIKCAGIYDVKPTTTTGNATAGGTGTGACFDLTFESTVCLGSSTQAFNKVFADGVQLSGDVTLGDTAADDITVSGDITSHIIPNASDTYNLGSVTQRWEDGFIDDVDACTGIFCDVTNSTSTTTGALQVKGGLGVACDVCVGGNINATGNIIGANITASGNITLGDADTDELTIGADVHSHIIPNASDTYNLGATTKRWEDAYIDDICADTINTTGTATLACGIASSLQVCDLTTGRIALAGTNGEVEDSSNLTFSASRLSVTGDADVSGATCVTDTTNSTSASSGAVIVTGGLGVGCDVHIGGSLTVAGTQTAVCSNCVLIGDAIMTLNADETGTPSENAGLEIERGTDDNAHITWNETTDKFELKLGTALADLCVANVITDSSGSGSAIGTPAGYAGVFHRTPQLTSGYSGTREGASVCLENTDGLADAIHILNDTILNVRRDTYVRDISWSTDSDYDAGQCISSANTAIAFTFCWMGNPSCIDIDWGDGTSDCKLTSVSCDGSCTVSKTYGSGAVGCNTVCATAKHTSGIGYGSEITLDCTDYMLIATPTPDIEWAMYDGNPANVTTAGWDSASAACICNTSTETGATTSYGNTADYTIFWGDSSDACIATDAAAGGRDGAGLAHTWTNSPDADTRYSVCLRMDNHSTTNPSVLPLSEVKCVCVWSSQTPAFTSDVNSGNNEEATSGLVVNFTGTVDTLGSASNFGAGNCWKWTFDDGSTCEVAAGGGGAGDYNVAVAHTFDLTTGEQASGTTVTRDVCLQAYNGHTSSPFVTSACTITIKPDPRSNVAVIFQNESTGIDNASNVRGYAVTGYDGLNYALGCAANTSQNATCYEYNWGDSSALDCMAHGSSNPGDVGTNITHDYTSVGTGTYNGNLLAYNPTLSLNATDDTENFTMDILATPAAPAGLSAKTIGFTGEDTGTSPKLAHGFTDNTGGATLSAGSAVDRTTDTGGTIDSDIISSYAYNSAAGAVCALVNGSADGAITFTASDNSGLTSSMCITEDIDANTVSATGVGVSGSSKIYPSNFYRVFKAKVSKTASAVSVGLNSYQICHTVTGATPEIEFVKDDVTSTPSLDISASTVTQAGAGTLAYISGIPYYTTGATVTLGTVKAYDWIGQTYQDTSTPFSIEHASNDESTSGSIISTQTKTYANIDGSSTFLNGGNPVADTGKASGSKYTLGDITFSVNGSVNAVGTVKANLSNINGEGGYSTFTTKINLKGTSISGFDEEDITITTLGTGSGDAKRIVIASAAGDNPTYSSSTDYYASNAWTGTQTIAGTDEAVARWGQLKHFSTDLSSGYLPAGPDLNTGRSGAQYFRGAFKRSVVSSFDILLNGKISGFWIALPGETTDASSGLGGWLDCTATYGGAGMPGSNTGAGGNGSDGVASGNSNKVTTGSAVNSTFTMTLGTANLSNTYNNLLFFNIKLASGDYIDSLSFS